MTSTINRGSFSSVPLRLVEEFWNRRPCHFRRSDQPAGTKEYFDEVNYQRYFVEPHIATFAQFDKWTGKHVLEIGCGMGTDAINFARAGAKVTAVDVSEKSLDLARRQAKIYGLSDRIKFYKADAENLIDIVPPKPYDLVYSMGVIHHTPHPEVIIQQIRQHYVSRKTELKLMLYHRFSWRVFSIILKEGHGRFWRLDELVAANSEAQSGCPVTYSYSRNTVHHLLKGFKITRASIDFIFPYRQEEYQHYKYVKKLHFRLMPKPIMRMLEKTLGWQLLITAKPSGRVKT